MIIGNLFSKSEEFDSFPVIIKQVIEFLQKLDFENLENKKYRLLGDEVSLLIVDYKTMPIDKKDAEQHKKYIDFHYMIDNEENNGIGFENKENIVSMEYNIDNDSKLFTKVKDESYLTIKKGMFAIFFPNDIHRTGLESKTQNKVRKAILKIDIKLLKSRKVKSFVLSA